MAVKPFIDKQLLFNHIKHAGSYNKVLTIILPTEVFSPDINLDSGREGDVATAGTTEEEREILR